MVGQLAEGRRMGERQQATGRRQCEDGNVAWRDDAVATARCNGGAATATQQHEAGGRAPEGCGERARRREGRGVPRGTPVDAQALRREGGGADGGRWRPTVVDGA